MNMRFKYFYLYVKKIKNFIKNKKVLCDLEIGISLTTQYILRIFITYDGNEKRFINVRYK